VMSIKDLRAVGGARVERYEDQRDFTSNLPFSRCNDHESMRIILLVFHMMGRRCPVAAPHFMSRTRHVF
jgi:hypothetical protein